MKLVRYGPAGLERPGVLDGNGRVRDLRGHVPDLTPPGVGFGRKPPVYPKAGDRIALGIEGLGEQTHAVVAARDAVPPAEAAR